MCEQDNRSIDPSSGQKSQVPTRKCMTAIELDEDTPSTGGWTPDYRRCMKWEITTSDHFGPD